MELLDAVVVGGNVFLYLNLVVMESNENFSVTKNRGE